MIYVLEDDTSIRELTLYALKAAGLEAKAFERAEEFLAAAESSPPELAVLDVMLPGGTDGFEAMRRLHSFAPAVPVIIASAKGDEIDKVSGLDLGADDYLVKPFSMLELTSRVKALLRRSRAGRNADTPENRLVRGDVTLDRHLHSVTAGGRSVDLTRKEFALLELVMAAPGRVFTREVILASVWAFEKPLETRTVDMHVSCIRSKLQRPWIIETVRGIGYRLGGEN